MGSGKGFFNLTEAGVLKFVSPGLWRYSPLPGLFLDSFGGRLWLTEVPPYLLAGGASPSEPPQWPVSAQAIQHIEGTQDKQELEEEQRRAVIVKPVRSCPEAHTSDTASDSEASDSDAMDQSREEPLGDGELP